MRTEIEHLAHLLSNLAVAHSNLGCAIGIHAYAHWLSDTDGIADLHQHLACHTSCHHVLGYPTCCICGRTVHFGWVFSRESTTTVCATTTISIYNNLSSSQTCIAMRASDNEVTCRIHQQFEVALQQFRISRIALCYARQQHALNICLDLLLRSLLIVLGTHYDGINTQWFALLTILHSHLALGVWTEIQHLLTFFTHTRKRIY